MYLHLFFLSILLWANTISANTETIVFKVPKYYEVPSCSEKFQGTSMTQVNSSTYLLSDFPIQSLKGYSTKDALVSIPYDYATKDDLTLFVKLNNYENSAFDSDDLINVKLCWPATTPIDISLDHVYVKSSHFNMSGPETLDIYVKIELHGDFYAVRDVHEDKVEFNLVVSKLPGGLPIPIELYSFIMYVVDLMIVLYAVFPYVYQGFEMLAKSTETKTHVS